MPNKKAKSTCKDKRKNNGRPMGRPTKYNSTVAEEFCRHISEGKSINNICSTIKGMPTNQTIANWLIKNKEFFDMYWAAKLVGVEIQTSDCIDIADNIADKDDVPAASLQVKTRQWQAERLLRLYSPKQLIESKETIEIDSSRLQEVVNIIREKIVSKGSIVPADTTKQIA